MAISQINDISNYIIDVLLDFQYIIENCMIYKYNETYMNPIAT